MRQLLVALALTAAACGTSEVTVAPEPPSTTLESVPAVAEPTSTTSAASSTTTTTAGGLETTLTSPASTFFHEGTPMIRFSVEVGEGVDLSRDDLARFVIDTLSDSRSWIGRGAGFELLDEGGDFTMIVALPDEVDRMCEPLQTIGRYSCARNGWIAFNSLRWFGATEDWPADIDTYRRYLVNHEVGHYIVGPNHDSCPGPGQLAPVMMQQTKGLDGCEPNGWVDPA